MSHIGTSNGYDSAGQHGMGWDRAGQCRAGHCRMRKHRLFLMTKALTLFQCL